MSQPGMEMQPPAGVLVNDAHANDFLVPQPATMQQQQPQHVVQMPPPQQQQQQPQHVVQMPPQQQQQQQQQAATVTFEQLSAGPVTLPSGQVWELKRDRLVGYGKALKSVLDFCSKGGPAEWLVVLLQGLDLPAKNSELVHYMIRETRGAVYVQAALQAGGRIDYWRPKSDQDGGDQGCPPTLNIAVVLGLADVAALLLRWNVLEALEANNYPQSLAECLHHTTTFYLSPRMAALAKNTPVLSVEQRLVMLETLATNAMSHLPNGIFAAMTQASGGWKLSSWHNLFAMPCEYAWVDIVRWWIDFDRAHCGGELVKEGVARHTGIGIHAAKGGSVEILLMLAEAGADLGHERTCNEVWCVDGPAAEFCKFSWIPCVLPFTILFSPCLCWISARAKTSPLAEARRCGNAEAAKWLEANTTPS